jgi:hypothetical protein
VPALTFVQLSAWGKNFDNRAQNTGGVSAKLIGDVSLKLLIALRDTAKDNKRADKPLVRWLDKSSCMNRELI